MDVKEVYGSAFDYKWGIYYHCTVHGCLEEVEMFPTKESMTAEYKKLKEAYKKENLPLIAFRFKVLEDGE